MPETIFQLLERHSPDAGLRKQLAWQLVSIMQEYADEPGESLVEWIEGWRRVHGVMESVQAISDAMRNTPLEELDAAKPELTVSQQQQSEHETLFRALLLSGEL